VWTSCSFSPPGSSPTKCSMRRHRKMQASCSSFSAGVARWVPCSCRSSTRCSSQFPMCLHMSGPRKLYRRLLVLHASSLNRRRGRWFNPTFQVSWWWCGLNTLTLFPPKLGVPSRSQSSRLSRLSRRCSFGRQKLSTTSATSCTSVRSFISWWCTTSTLPVALRKMAGPSVRRSIRATC
jgi:hypothetical protein